MHLFFRFVIFCVLSAFLFHAPSAFADDNKIGIGLGAGVGVSTSEYKKMDATVLPFPLVQYSGDVFFLHGLSAGAFLYKDDMHKLAVHVSYMAQSYDASQSDSWSMRQLKDRYSSLFAGASYSLSTQWGIGKLAFSGDTLGTSHGFMGEAGYAYPFMFDRLYVAPNAGVVWTSSQYNNYYYGVSDYESKKSGLKEYRADDGFSPYLGIDSHVRLTEDWAVFMNGKVSFLSNEIKDSPMVNKDAKVSLGAGVSYSF